MDISGAFDNAWFPAIIRQLDQHNVPSSLIKIIQSFLSNRKVTLSHSNKVREKTISKGCPQGGIFSPFLWNLLLNEFLTNFNHSHAKAIAFADDITFVIWNNDIHGLRSEIIYCFNQIQSWCNKVKLKISTPKTNILYLHNKEKLPVSLNNLLIQPSDTVKILGIHVGNHRHRHKLNFNHHVTHIIHKGTRMKNALFAYCARTWGIDSRKRIILLKAMLRPALSYGAEIWFPYITKNNIKKLDSLQYQVLVRCIQAYRTTQSTCAHLLAKTPFLSDFLRAKVMKFDQSASKDTIDLFFQNKFDEYMTNSNENFRTFFPSLIPDHVLPNRYTTLFFTGHGPFYSFINKINAHTDTPKQYCSCGSEETPLHLLTDCTHTQNIISKFFTTRTPHQYIDTIQNYIAFTHICKYILTRIQHRTQH